MPDFTPDTTIYRPQNQMDAGSMLGLVQRMRELNTQSGIAEAIRANPNDPTAAYSAAAQNPNVMMGPGDVTNFVHAQAAQAELGRYYTDQVGKGIAGLYAKSISRAGASGKDWDTFAAVASHYVKDPSVLAAARNSVVRPDGRLDPTQLATLWNTISGGQQLPQQQYQTSAGRTETAPAATFTTGGPAAGGAGTTPGSATISAPGATIPPETSTKQFVAARDSSLNYNQETYPLRATIHALEELPEQGTGEGTEAVTKIKNFLTVVGADKALGIDTKDITNYETAKKYMIQWANSVSAAGTNDRLSAAIAGNPNMTLLKSTNLNIAKTALALRRIQQVQYDEFKRSGLSNDQYADWAAQWNKSQDPRAYAFDLMGKENAQKLLKSMPPNSPERKKFEASLDAASRSGLAEGNL